MAKIGDNTAKYEILHHIDGAVTICVPNISYVKKQILIKDECLKYREKVNDEWTEWKKL